jgi:uncharacterized membrane protein YcaP (DUF421 family)
MGTVLIDILTTALQAAIAVAILFGLTWLIWKKPLSQCSALEITCFVASGASAAILALQGNYAKAVTAILVFMLVPYAFSLLKSRVSRAHVNPGAPLLLVENGAVQKNNLKKAGINEAELFIKCKRQGARVQDIEFAVLEPGGNLYIQMPEGAEPATKTGVAPYWGLSLNMIIEGKIIQEHLSIADRDINWILDELKRQNINDVHQVLLAYFDAANQFFVHTYQK